MTKRTADLIPWWVGPRAKGRMGEFVYWDPVEDAVDERVAREVDVDRWLENGRFEYVLVELGRSGLMLFKPGRITTFADGGVCYELEVPDEIAYSRDLVAVCEFLFSEAMAALAAIGKRYALGMPSRWAGEPARKRGQIAELVERHQRQLVLLSPRYRHRPSLDVLRAELDKLGEVAGWEVFAAVPNVPPPATGLAAHYDFSGLPSCVDLETLLVDSRNVLVLVAAKGTVEAQRQALTASLAHVDGLLPTTVRVIGNDSGTLWLSAGLTGTGWRARHTG